MSAVQGRLALHDRIVEAKADAPPHLALTITDDTWPALAVARRQAGAAGRPLLCINLLQMNEDTPNSGVKSALDMLKQCVARLNVRRV